MCLVMGYVFLGVTLGVLLLLVHLKYRQSEQGSAQYVEDPCEQWFRWSRLRPGERGACSHEMAIVALLLLGVVAVMTIALEDCGKEQRV